MKKRIFSFKRVSKDYAEREITLLKYELKLCEERQNRIRNRISDLEKLLGLK